MDRADFLELKILALHVKRDQERQLIECSGKHGFETRTDARVAIRERLRKTCEPYRCSRCGLWHVGNRTQDRRVKKAKRRIREEMAA